MFNPWYPVMLLAFEASEVVTLRMLKMGRGGADAWDEAHLMVSEKICAGLEVFSSMMTGSLPLACVERYREHVAANASRLVSTKPCPISEQELARILQEPRGLLPTAHRRSA